MIRRINSNYGMTLIEIIVSLIFLTLIVVGFSAVFTFTGTTVTQSGNDSGFTADARSSINDLLSVPVDPKTGESVDVGIAWYGADEEQIIPVIRDGVKMSTSEGTDSEMNVYRKPPQEKPAVTVPPESVVLKSITLMIGYTKYDYTFRDFIDRIGGISYSEIITRDFADVIVRENGSMPDYWEITYEEYVDGKIRNAVPGMPTNVVWDKENVTINRDAALHACWNN